MKSKKTIQLEKQLEHERDVYVKDLTDMNEKFKELEKKHAATIQEFLAIGAKKEDAQNRQMDEMAALYRAEVTENQKLRKLMRSSLNNFLEIIQLSDSFQSATIINNYVSSRDRDRGMVGNGEQRGRS